MANVVLKFECGSLIAETPAFESLAKLHNVLLSHSDDNIAIDCSRVRWFDAHLAAPFMTVISHNRLNGNKINLIELSDDVSLILRKNGMLKQKAEDSYHTTIPLTAFELDEEVDFAQYSREHLARKEMPKMSEALLRKFFEGVDELFANCALHSKAKIRVFAAGQFFPKSDRLAFAISDGGRGIDGSLRASNINYASPQDAIDWAMQPKNTTRQGDIPGGLGLKVLREFIEKNNGKLTVISSAGFWCQSGGVVTKTRLVKPFPGTTVIMEIVTSDKKVYDLKTSANPRNIW